MPEADTARQVTSMDYRRVVIAIAGPALLIFVPSLILASVPAALWLPFSLMALVAAVFISAGFLYVSRGSPISLVTPLMNGIVLASVGTAFRPYYHALDLLFALIVSGHAIVHGIGPGLIAAGVGTLVVTFALHDPAMANWSDVLYAMLYLSGAALLPWTAWQLAERRAHLLRRSRHDIEAQRARLEAILRGIDDAVIVVGRGGEVVLTNAAYDRIASKLADLAEPRDERGRRLRKRQEPQARAVRGESFEMSFTLAQRDGERRWYEAKGAPFGDAYGFHGGVVVIRDITDRSLRIQEEEFMATASHELRTPIAALHGYVQLLERKIDPDLQPREAEFARVALSQARRVGVLLERLFDLARLQSGQLDVELQPVDLTEVVLRAVAAARQLVSGHEIAVAAPDRSITVEADPGRLEQVLLNLLANAIEHAPGTERIEVSVGLHDGRATVSVHDHGPGIPPRQLARLFGERPKGSKAAGRNQGLGLGLYISRELMRAQRGSIAISSEPDQGTTAVLELPLVERSPLRAGVRR